MDQSRFDQFTKRLGSSRVTRLAALRGLAVGALAAALGVADPDEAVARKRCGECEKRRRRKTKSGKVRIRCRTKPNGTACSVGTCQSGVCTRSVVAGPAPAPDPAVCVPNQPCTGANAGLVCNAQGTACVACTVAGQCSFFVVDGFAVRQACIRGFCVGGEACAATTECFAPLTCINVPGGGADKFCLLDRKCTEDEHCNDDEICLAGACLTRCTGPGANCGPGRTCEGHFCVPD